jgi:hypothetical protein
MNGTGSESCRKNDGLWYRFVAIRALIIIMDSVKESCQLHRENLKFMFGLRIDALC